MTIANEGVIFGERLRVLRVERDLSQSQLAERCGSNRPFISNLERGVKVPSLTMVLRLAEALECRVYDLVKVFDEGSRAATKPRRRRIDQLKAMMGHVKLEIDTPKSRRRSRS